jgi:hypothetical protein
MLFPLARPLDNSVLVTPVQVGNRGYFLFELDPFAPRTKIDGDLASHGPDDDLARVDLALGKISQTVDAELIDARSLDRGDLAIAGVIGSDILREDMLFGVDRSAGYAWLASDAGYHRPEQAYDYLALGGGARVLARLGNDLRDLRIDLTSRGHRLGYSKWPTTEEALLEDFSGTIEMPSMTVLEHRVGPVAFDKYTGTDADGVLGMAFFAPYDFVLDRGQHLFYLTDRHGLGPLLPRIARWGTTPCAHAGCVSLELVDNEAGHGVRVRRDPEAARIPLELTLAALDLPDAPLLVITLPEDVRAWTAPIDPRYFGHTLQLVDMSPFPPVCEARTGDQCVRVDEIAQATAVARWTPTPVDPLDAGVGLSLDR